MTGISAAGVGSGLDLEALIQVSIDAMKVPQEARLSERRDTLDVTLSAVGAVKSALSAFKEVLDKAKDETTFFPRSAYLNGSLISTASSDEDGEESSSSSSAAYGVTIGSDAVNGSYEVEVLALAQGSRATSQTEYSGSDAVITTQAGELTFAAGSGANEDSFTVEVTSGMTLSQLREAVNNAAGNFGVNANLINTGSGTRLVLDSSKSGADVDGDATNGNPNDLRIISSGAANPDLNNLVSDIQTTQSASAAKISVNGIEAQSETNYFSDVISGLSINVNSLTSSSTTLEIKPNSTAAVDSVKEFVKVYNKVISEIDKYSKPEEVTEGEDNDRKELSGDAMFRSMKYSLGRMTTKGYDDPNDPSRVTTFYALGIDLQKDGTLELDEDKLNEWVEGDLDKLGELFAGEDGVVNTFYSYVESFEKFDGVLASREDSVKDQLRELDRSDLALKERMAEYESTLRSKYTAFDVTMGSLNNQMSYIMTQLGS